MPKKAPKPKPPKDLDVILARLDELEILLLNLQLQISNNQVVIMSGLVVLDDKLDDLIGFKGKGSTGGGHIYFG